MRSVKGAALIGILFISVGILVLSSEGKADPVHQPQFEKPAIWEDDVLVYQGNISRYSDLFRLGLNPTRNHTCQSVGLTVIN